MVLQLKLGEQLLNGELVVCGDGFRNATEQGAGFQRAMIRNRHVVRSIKRGCQTDVGAVLSRRFVAKHPQSSDEFGCANVAGDFHAASASSRTKWRRMIFGIGPGTPSPK